MYAGRKRERYERMNLPGDSEGDPAQFGQPTMMEAPWEGFDEAWQVVASLPEATVGTVFTFGRSRMNLVRDESRRAFGLQNTRTGKIKWIPMDQAPFGYDQIETTIDLGDYRESGISTQNNPLARMLQKEAARAPKRNVFAEWAARGADLNHRSIFKPRFDTHGKRVR